jgi:hypothetical protein
MARSFKLWEYTISIHEVKIEKPEAIYYKMTIFNKDGRYEAQVGFDTHIWTSDMQISRGSDCIVLKLENKLFVVPKRNVQRYANHYFIQEMNDAISRIILIERLSKMQPLNLVIPDNHVESIFIWSQLTRDSMVFIKALGESLGSNYLKDVCYKISQ